MIPSIRINPISIFLSVQLSDGSLVRVQTDQLRTKYQAIEYDVHRSAEEKIPFMIEWWTKVQSILIASNLDKSLMRDVVNNSELKLRTGVKDFITGLLRVEIPILIFSAGLGDVIEMFLEKEIPEFRHGHESSHIVANFLEFTAEGKLKAFNKKMIHSFNKNEHEIHDTPYYQSIVHRPNVILLGDSVGDVGMSNGMKNLRQILKVGFLNRSTPVKLDIHKRVYDIVVCDDQTFDVPNELLKAI